ncbi:MAG TPA: ParB N-terminal domain-containing protein [Paracoccaceae bacterium]|nr:ParB N-terminal domain-containing protein [Paracoccaceae bacterium]
MSGERNRFGFGPSLAPERVAVPRQRGTGPMSAAVREAAENLLESTEAKMEARRRNAADARAFREAQEDGRVLVRIALAEIAEDDLPRDRLDLEAVASSDEMDELKASILTHGQREPIEVYPGPEGKYQLKKGWRRLTALRQLLAETGEERFGSALARIAPGEGERTEFYIDRVEENAVREDLTFAEMAHVALRAAEDPGVEENSAEALVGRLYASLHKMKRSYIRSFVYLLEALGPDLPFPKAVARNLGVEVARKLREAPGEATLLRATLGEARSAEEQNRILSDYLAMAGDAAARPKTVRKDGREKYEFHFGSAKITARRGEVRIKDAFDFSEVSRDTLEEAVAAFHAVLRSRM